MATDPDLRRHQEWLGYLQPVGLTVTPAALLAAQAHVNTSIHAEQQAFIRQLTEGGEKRVLGDFNACFRDVLRWEESDLVADLQGKLDVPLPEYGETLTPSFAVPDPEDKSRWQMLVQVLPTGTDLDRSTTPDRERWHASPQARFERLLWENQVPIGLLVNGEAIRLVYAPRGESSGHLTFPVGAMAQVAGRPIFAAFHLLFSSDRLFTLPRNQRLPHILSESRRYQNEVSTELSEQVVAALYELLRGFREADWAVKGTLLRDTLQNSPDDVYGGLLSTLMRLVFLLYAEERDLLSSHPAYINHYSVSGLFARLRRDQERFPDTMDQRYGAWAQLLVLFRLIHDGASHGSSFTLPPRHGRLFDPDAYPFLEGRPRGSKRIPGAQVTPPKLSDGVVYRVLERLLILRGERISYRALDVEQIGSVYEAMMGFSLRIVNSRAVALRPDHIFVELDDILQTPPADRSKLLKEFAGCDVTGVSLDSLKSARTHPELEVALAKKFSPRSPEILPEGSLYLQPTEERRRSGSHYTPRSLTAPIVEKTLEPVLAALGPSPKPEQILDLKVCDPAMGSGAFLVEVCRLLGKKLLAAWTTHKALPKLAPDEDLEKHAQRLIAQTCLYGVDKNPFAVDLAKLSLWLATMAKQHSFTFLDHALRNGDSLVGLSRNALASFHWAPQEQKPLITQHIARAMQEAEDLRSHIQTLAPSDDTDEKARLLASVEHATQLVRLIGDAVVSAFFSAQKEKDRVAQLTQYSTMVQASLHGKERPSDLELVSQRLREGTTPTPPLHWEIEFPEVFTRFNGGFDAIVGNPPFSGKNTTASSLAAGYIDWLKNINVESHGNADLVAHFFRRAFALVRTNGLLGLLATKTIGQGDTRYTGLRWICLNGGVIYSARRHIVWPGAASVVVSVVHIRKGASTGSCDLDGKPAPQITAFLLPGGSHESPSSLAENSGMSFQGPIPLGMGFTFDDEGGNGQATSITEMNRLLQKNPRNGERIFPYIGGEELNTSPTQEPRRYVINFGEMSEEEARKWPDLMRIVESQVKPERLKNKREARRKYWWRFGECAPALSQATTSLNRVLVHSFYSAHVAFAFVPAKVVVAGPHNVFPIESYAAFCVLQSRAHEVWARTFGSTMGETLRYTPSDCFETFPFPAEWEINEFLKNSGSAYYTYRAQLMVQRNEGLTKTYNHFHDPEDLSPDTQKLRELHAAMDRAVLDAYGWKDLQPRCDFILDSEEEEDEGGENRRKKPWRYRWADEDRDEILGRLLALNKQRAEEEAIQAPPPATAKAGRKRKTSQDDPHQPTLF